MAEHIREYTADLLNELCARHGLSLRRIDVKNSWDSVPAEVLPELERLLEAFPVKRSVDRGENIFALYQKCEQQNPARPV